MVEGVGEVLRLHGHPRIRPEDGTTRRMRVGPAGLMPLGGVAAGRATSRRRHGRGEIAHASSGSLGGVGWEAARGFIRRQGPDPSGQAWGVGRVALRFLFLSVRFCICGISFSYLQK